VSGSTYSVAPETVLAEFLASRPAIRSLAAALANFDQDVANLTHSVVEVIVDDCSVTGLMSDLALEVTSLDPRGDLLWRVASTLESPALLALARCIDKQQHGIFELLSDCHATMDVDLEHDVRTRRRIRDRCPLPVVEKVHPFEKAAIVDMGLERFGRHEVVRIERLTRPGRASRPATRQPELRIAGHEIGNNRALPDPTGAGDNDEERVR